MSIRKQNEDFCGSLPLHLINHIQDYGVLLVVDRDGRFIQCSVNSPLLLGSDPESIIGRELSDFLSEASCRRIADLTGNARAGRRIAQLSFLNNDGLYPAIVHPGEAFHLIEVELAPAGQQTFISVYEEVKSAMANIQECATIQEACDTALLELKRFSGFDRLLVYRFDEDWNGTVIAQLREDFMSDYLGLRFPVSDIPRQARALYQTNPYRLIPNREYTPVRLHPVVNPLTSGFTDLSACNLRSVAGVHLEYMRNMDTMASMSTRILINGKLWGLISCHQRNAKLLSYEHSSVFELISDVVASRIATLDTAAKSSVEVALQQQLAHFIERLYISNDLSEAIRDSELLRLFGASGLIYTHTYHIGHFGDVPDDNAIRDLLFWLDTRHRDTIFSTRSLRGEFDEWKSYSGAVCGMLSIPIRTEQQEYLILLRGEVLEEVHWGGNPNEALQMEHDGKSYHPRHSFTTYREAVSGYSSAWTEAEKKLAHSIRQAITEFLLLRQ